MIQHEQCSLIHDQILWTNSFNESLKKNELLLQISLKHSPEY